MLTPNYPVIRGSGYNKPDPIALAVEQAEEGLCADPEVIDALDALEDAVAEHGPRREWDAPAARRHARALIQGAEQDARDAWQEFTRLHE